ncbi:COX assembly mitochondrial protein homolog [Lineus longissimus]|uniref:COX assembly mitochondrial protein homolog n=1 Tax=Lineus longissimus TaxID=88925 RepID=UPI002B4F913D
MAAQGQNENVTDKTGKNDENFHEHHDDWQVLSGTLGGGPLGFGDPNDRSLRRVEEEVMIPKIMKSKAHKEHCLDLVKAFNQCGKEQGLLLPFFCRKSAKAMNNCLSEWYDNKEFRDECTEIYLRERSEYRRTGIRKKAKKGF